MTLILIISIGVTRYVFPMATSPAMRHQSFGAVLERIQRKASLVVMNMNLTDVATTTLTGRTGSTSLILIIRGDVQVASDLQEAEFKNIDEDRRRATLLLPVPVPDRPRLDWQRSQVYRIDRGGLWRIMPGTAGERELINAALRQAQRRLMDAASDHDLIREAKAFVADRLTTLFAATGWQIKVEWKQDEPQNRP